MNDDEMMQQLKCSAIECFVCIDCCCGIGWDAGHMLHKVTADPIAVRSNSHWNVSTEDAESMCRVPQNCPKSLIELENFHFDIVCHHVVIEADASSPMRLRSQRD